MRSSLVAAAAVAGTAFLLACGNTNATRRGGVKHRKNQLAIPYAVGEPVDDAPVKAKFARAAWLLVDDGYSGLRTNIAKEGVALLGHFVDDSTPILYNRLHRLTFHGRSVRFGAAQEVDPEDLLDLGLAPPAETLWLFGPGSPCLATVGEPSVGRASRASRTLEVSYALDGCEVHGDKWSPAAVIAESMPLDVTWMEATEDAEVSFAVDEAWDHPLARWALAPDTEAAPARYVAHARTVSWLNPSPTQLLVTALFEEGEDRCLDRELHRATLGWWSEPEFEEIIEPQFAPSDPPLLLGALSRAGDAQALIFAENTDGFIAVVPAVHPQLVRGQVMEVDPGPESWTRHPLVRGSWTEADRAGAGFSVLGDCQ